MMIQALRPCPSPASRVGLLLAVWALAAGLGPAAARAEASPGADPPAGAVAPAAEDRSGPGPDPRLAPIDPAASDLLVAAGPTRPAGPAARAKAMPAWRAPPAADWRYRLSRSGVVGEGRLRWEPAEGRYRLRLEGEVPWLGPLIVQTSEGSVDAQGLVPRRFSDRRLRRGEQVASFSRPAGGPVTVQSSAHPEAQALPPGSQDRLSVVLQLAGLAAAWKTPPAEPFTLPVVGARGDLAHWTLRVVGTEAVRPVGAAPVAALKLERVVDDPQETRVELWLDPAAGHLPLRMRLSDGRGEPLDLLRHP